jgi:hypothetical protein
MQDCICDPLVCACAPENLFPAPAYRTSRPFRRALKRVNQWTSDPSGVGDASASRARDRIGISNHLAAVLPRIAWHNVLHQLEYGETSAEVLSRSGAPESQARAWLSVIEAITNGNICDFCWRCDGLTGRSCRSTKGTSRVVAWMRAELLPLSAKPSKMQDTPVLESELERSDKHTKSVLHASAKIDRRSFREIFGRAGDFADLKSKMNALRQRLVVKNEVIRIFQQWKF